VRAPSERLTSPTMADEEDDLDGMWDELGDDDEHVANVSGNLAQLLGISEKVVHEGDVDEGRMTWEPPAFHGLDNSDEVTISTRHWYRDERDNDGQKESPAKAAEPAGGHPLSDMFAGPAVQVQTNAGTLVFNTGASADGTQGAPFSMFTFDANGRIQW